MKKHALQTIKGIASFYLQSPKKCLSPAIHLPLRQSNYQNSTHPLALTHFLKVYL